MLILTRIIGKKIIIGDGEDAIEVVILGVNGCQVRVGVNAPKNVSVHRDEIYQKIQNEKRARIA